MRPSRAQIYRAAAVVAEYRFIALSCFALETVVGHQMAAQEYQDFYKDVEKAYSFINVMQFAFENGNMVPRRRRQLHRSLALLLYAEAREDVLGVTPAKGKRK